MGYLTNLVSGVMDNVIENKVAQNKKKLENDPKLQKLEAELSKKIEAFNKHMGSRLSEDEKKKFGLK